MRPLIWRRDGEQTAVHAITLCHRVSSRYNQLIKVTLRSCGFILRDKVSACRRRRCSLSSHSKPRVEEKKNNQRPHKGNKTSRQSTMSCWSSSPDLHLPPNIISSLSLTLWQLWWDWQEDLKRSKPAFLISSLWNRITTPYILSCVKVQYVSPAVYFLLSVKIMLLPLFHQSESLKNTRWSQSHQITIT